MNPNSSVERVKESWPRLIVAARELNESRDRLRSFASNLAGCSLVDWSFEDVQRYVDLYIKHARKILSEKCGDRKQFER